MSDSGTATPSSTDTVIADTVAEYLQRYSSADACAAELLCDRHDPAATAFTIIDEHLDSYALTYGELGLKSRQFASVLSGHGVGRGDCVAVLMAKSEELLVALLAIWRLGAVHVPLFTAFATPAIKLRMEASGARVVVVDPDQVQKLDGTTGLDVILADGDFLPGLADQPEFTERVAVGGEGMLVQLFTSGTMGNPKGVPVPLRALAAFEAYMNFALDLTAEDVFWNAADPGWAYGLYYGILGPMAAGRANLLLHAGFSTELFRGVFFKFHVSNFASAPTVYRSLSRDPKVTGISLRRASSAGEPLTPDVNVWSAANLGIEVRDHYGQTELGMAICNCWHPALAETVKPGSMGKPLPGFSAGIVDGQVAVDITASPLNWFTEYVNAPEKTAERYSEDGRWYLTGDVGRVDDDGFFFFTSRDDDVILMAGYRIGPFDVESVMVTHPLVAEVAVVGKPDELRGEVLEAYVVLTDPAAAGDALVTELQQLVKTGFAAHAYPRRVHFVQELPKTPSGKVQRFILRKLDDQS